MFTGEKPAKPTSILARIKPGKKLNLAKINPACTSHTDRVYGVDVL
jgi:hypothetical protein